MTNEPAIRVAGPSDIDSLFEIRTSVRENYMSREGLAEHGIMPDTLPEMLSGAGRGWVAEEDGKIIAFAMANTTEATVFAMFVRPECEGRGFGRRLMKRSGAMAFFAKELVL